MNKQKLIELRCKAWGITEDEYYCNQCSDFSLEDMARAYRRGKNKGARDKAIQNVGFYQKQMQDIYDKKNKQIAELEKRCNELFFQVNEKTERIADLEKENAELKETFKTYNGCGDWDNDFHTCRVYLQREELQECTEQLTKAIEIIREFVEWANWQGNSKCPSFKSIQDKAEQFLSEVEKCGQ